MWHGDDEIKAWIWAYPAVVLLMQLVPTPAAAAGGLALCAGGALIARGRSVPLLFGLTALGHCGWVYFCALLAGWGVTGAAAVVAGRLGLAGYLLVFALWQRVAPLEEHYVHAGSAMATICFPGIWSGRREPVWRFVCIFSGICLAFILALGLSGLAVSHTLGMGLLFALVNATLEELLWRGLILPRVVDVAGERQGLVLTALAFGLYHLSLGFPLWACLIFAVGGFYMGGSAIISKGLVAPWVMHVMVNLIFVFAGLIF